MEKFKWVKRGGVRRKVFPFNCVECNKIRWYTPYQSKLRPRCKKCAIIAANTPERNAKIGNTLRNKYKTDAEWKRRVLAARVVKSGENHWNWKGGITPLTQRTRTGEEVNAWKLAVLMRDGYKCRICGIKDYLQAHHINGWAEFPEDRFILENGLTLCKEHHKFYHDYEREIRKNGHYTVE